MPDTPTAVLDRLDDTMPTWGHLLEDIPTWPIRDPDPPLTTTDHRLQARPAPPVRHWSTSTRTLERLLDGLRHL